MPCYHPMRARQAYPGGPIKVLKKTDLSPSNLKLPCANCIGCRLERSKQWALRLMHEAQLHEANSFITLTYDKKALAKARGDFEDSAPRARRQVKDRVAHRNHPLTTTLRLPYEDSLSKRDAQLFLKRLRKELTTRNPSTRIKYYLVGEYGDKNKRPHFHAAIFGEGFTADACSIGKSPSGQKLWRSPLLERAWDKGFSSVGRLTFESAAYIARYVMKKVNGKQASEHYKRVHPETGEVYYLTPEFALMSRGGRKNKGGLASTWYEKYSRDVYPHDFVVMNGQKHKPPRYYDKLLERVDREAALLTKLEREFTARSAEADNTPKRLRAKEKVALARAKQSQRPLE